MEKAEYCQGLEELKDMHRKLQECRFLELVSPKERPSSLVGQNSTFFLLKISERANDLFEGILQAFEREKILVSGILTRSHFETTSALCYFYYNLMKYQDKEITEAEFEEKLGKLTVGSRKVYGDESEEFPKAINILTAIKVTDKLLRDAGSDVDMFSGSYESLSEITHPNFLGISYKTKTIVKPGLGKVEVLNDKESFEKNIKSILNRMLISASIYNSYLEKAYIVLKENETMPVLRK